jgi:hypothetical protein
MAKKPSRRLAEALAAEAGQVAIVEQLARQFAILQGQAHLRAVAKPRRRMSPGLRIPPVRRLRPEDAAGCGTRLGYRAYVACVIGIVRDP